MRLGPLRKIVEREFRTGYYGCQIGTGSVWLKLVCGHTTFRKASCEPRDKARCADCSDGSRVTRPG